MNGAAPAEMLTVMAEFERRLASAQLILAGENPDPDQVLACLAAVQELPLPTLAEAPTAELRALTERCRELHAHVQSQAEVFRARLGAALVQLDRAQAAARRYEQPTPAVAQFIDKNQ